MKPAPFTYAAPSTIDEAITLLAEHGDTVKLLAGGQSLMPMMNLRLARPQYIVDLNRIPALDYVTERDGALAVGALTRQRSLERSPTVRQDYPLLRPRGRVAGSPVSAWGQCTGQGTPRHTPDCRHRPLSRVFDHSTRA